MTVLNVDGLEVRASAAWQLVKWDETKAYRQGVGRWVEGSKAVDLVGQYKQELYLIEVKDFVGRHAENRQRLTSSELPIEVAQKVRDSVAGVVGAIRQEAQDIATFHGALLDHTRRMNVILWAFIDLNKRPEVLLNTLQQDLQKRLRWLHAKVRVATTQNGHFLPGITARRA